MSASALRLLTTLTSVVVMITVASISAASAQDYPSRTIKIVVPFPAGGPLDMTARLLAEKLALSFKQAFVVENRPGASGNIGTDAVAKAEPDGYTLLFVLDTPLTAHPTLYAKLPFDPVRDFEPISAVARFSLTLVVHPSVPVASVTEFVAYAKSKDRPLLYGSGGGRGDPGHLTMEYFRQHAGFEAIHVPYKGNAEVVMGVVGGQILAGFLATPGVAQVAREGRLKALAISSGQQTSFMPDVPTVAESGYPGFEARFCMVMLAPKGVPEPIRARLEREVRHAMQSPDLQARLQAQALEPIGSTGAEASELLKSASERWRTVIKTSNIRFD
ncbi:tripartite tricarboxylate transporter substrate binding protein [Bradyrhizobium sp. CB3481]|uniref:Bug family tripartite tricarboxylate transporter substrate binding protein n=1 Tax=Bradyrhizobium sp. CB3481 TaxID=3039158 RepID=UPI0024B27865|nr:tripartite tricarboxylate transporter substrate binding protein [Bradyrhizobium sp. CB3481]WFU19615.1 tripartite tricarboxylate transporter substrate binding protein [Bradyrhizobium sp. CB3481]